MAGDGLRELAAALQRAIGAPCIAEPDILRPAPDTLSAVRGDSIGNLGADSPVAAAVTIVDADESTVDSTTAEAEDTVAIPRRGPPPPPPGWDDEESESAVTPSIPFDDAAAELTPGELEQFSRQCRALGLMDEHGNFLSRDSTPSPAFDDEGEGVRLVESAKRVSGAAV